MKIKLKIVLSVFGFFMMSCFSQTMAQQKNYPDPDLINTGLKELQKQNPKSTKLTQIATSAGKHKVMLFEAGSEIDASEKTRPAILVVGNPDGNRPLASMAALKLAELVSSDKELLEKFTWYIIANANADAMQSYFDKPWHGNTRNKQEWNDDMDDQTDEDGYNDLNNDGFITKMRVKHPEGEWLSIEGESRLMKKADKSKGEKGVYKVYSEGLDDDGDGEYNEDLPGGTNVNKNFPHLFQSFTADGGIYPGSTPEAEAILRFAYEHPEIAMSFSFGASNFCMTAPKGGRKGEVDLTAIKIPKRYTGMLNADPDKKYSMQEIIEMLEGLVPAGMTVDESMVAGFLGLGAVVNPLKEDLVFYKKYNDEYKEYLKEKGIELKRFDPQKAGDGSYELWAYYHLGIPSFSMDLWSFPKPEEKKKQESGLTPDKIGEMSNDEFLALGEEKIAEFLKATGVPAQFSAKTVMAMVESGKTDTKQISSMLEKMKKPQSDGSGADPKELALLEYSDKVLGGQGFVNWEKYDHPDLGEVEIGGFIPYISTTPDFSMADSILEIQLPWITHLAGEIPLLKIDETKISSLGEDVYQLEVWIGNPSFLSFPIAMGKRNKQPAPAIVELRGDDFMLFSGLKRTPVQSVEGKSSQKVSWIVKADPNTEIQIRLTSKSAGRDEKTIRIAKK